MMTKPYNPFIKQPKLPQQDYLRGNDVSDQINEDFDDQVILTEVLPKDDQDALNG
jgi:hypothetical protein